MQGRALQLRIAQGLERSEAVVVMPPASTAKFRRKGVGVSLSIYLDGAHGRYLWRV